jgi:hypothetical protein
MLALAEAFRAEYGQAWTAARGDHERLAEIERERFGASHPEVTELLTRHWNLPEPLRETALASHALPTRLPGTTQRFRLVDCAVLSGRLADVWIRPDPAAAVAYALDLAREKLHMARDSLASALARMGGTIPDVAGDFEIDLGTEAEVQIALDQAREVLVRVALREAAALPAGGSSGADRAAFEAVLQDAFAASSRDDGALSVGVFHLGALPREKARGEVLEQLARAVAGALGGSDLASALGPGFLAFVLPGKGEKAAAQVADRILVRAPPLDGTGAGPLAFGFATHGPERRFESGAALLAAAQAPGLRGVPAPGARHGPCSAPRRAPPPAPLAPADRKG